MSEFNLDERIEQFNPAEIPGYYEVSAESIKQLIRDVIAEVTPEPKFIEWGVNNGGRMIDVDELEDKVKGLGL